ncbi:hypothetical protein ACIBMZ_25105 [Micromonospora sp. NPDC049900]|uniref:hypothetical protein n=1 Tax=Micromonospora sp. NPDC049900 TaxID=3364275 RepID=UPI0037ABE74F
MAVGNLADGHVQLTLPWRATPPTAEADAAADAVRDRFGATAVTRGALLGRDTGPEMPLLPDP